MIKDKNSAYPDKKPDLETESLRAWVVDKKADYFKNLDSAMKKDNSGDIEIKLKDGKSLKMCGFNIVRDKKTHKIVFAFKFKHESKFIILHYPEISKEEKVITFIEFLKHTAKMCGYEIQDSKEIIANIEREMHTLVANIEREMHTLENLNKNKKKT